VRGREADPVGPPGRVPDGTDVALERAAAGDDRAFAAVYDALSSRVYGLVLRVLRDAAQAEEVAQEVFVEVWRTAARFDPARGSAASWVLTLAHRRAVDRVRSAQAAADRDRRVAATEQLPPVDHVVEEVAATMERRQVRGCLQALTALQRESLVLAYYSGHTYREVAAMLEIPLPTVKSRMRDGLIRLRDCLGDRR
jgi:RNA polymerase sigma-70 factor (ECF subfamily)